MTDLADREFAATAEQFRFLTGRDISRTDLDKYVWRVFGIAAKTPKSLFEPASPPAPSAA